MTAADKGKEAVDLPGSKSVARAKDDARNPGGPELFRRTNYESQAGRVTQRQEVRSDGDQGVGSARTNLPQCRETGMEAGEGADAITQSTQATGPVRKTEYDWQTFLWAIAEKASKDTHHRFGGLYGWLNEDILRICFYRLRKDAASGVDGVTFQEYERNLEGNLTDLVGRLKRKSYRARLVRRKYIPKGNGKLRPLGIPALEDKLLQMAVAQILIAIYERDFLKCSYGYRPGQGPHDAVRDLTNALYRGNFNFVTEADVKGFLDPYSYYTLAAEGWSKSCGWLSKTRIRRPFCLPRLTWTTASSPRFTRCMTVCRETPRMRMASGIVT